MEINKRQKVKDRDFHNEVKATFDSNLYSLEESDNDEENSTSNPTKAPIEMEPNDIQPPKPPKGRKKVVSDSDEEENKRRDIENIHPNGSTEQDMEVDECPLPPKKRTIKKKVTREERFTDEEGFECYRTVEEYVEVEIEDTPNKNLKRPQLETKTTKFKPPIKGQSSLTSFFTRG